MIHIIHICDGHKHFKDAISEYEKRLWKKIQIHTLKPIKNTEIPFIKAKETEKIIEKMTKISGKIFLCDERWNHISTMKLSNCIQNLHNSSENIIFVIGWSYGFDISTIKKNFHNFEIIKLSEMILPHSLAFLVLIEQIYRSFEIIKGSGYHHE